MFYENYEQHSKMGLTIKYLGEIMILLKNFIKKPLTSKEQLILPQTGTS